MLKKAICLLVCVMTLVVCSSLVFAAIDLSAAKTDANTDLNKTKPVVVTIYINNAKSTYDDEITKKLADRFNAKLTSYDIHSGEKFIEKLNKMGVTDITSAERADIVGAFNGESVDYVVYAEVQPPIINSWRSMFNIGIKATVTIPVKILDIKNNKYLYNGKFTDQADNSTMFGGVGTKAAVLSAMDLVLVKTDEILTNRIPLN